LFGGEDFELCFTLAPVQQPTLEQLSKDLDLDLTVIGRTRAEPGCRCLDSEGREIKLIGYGYQHFY
jgi:thiamine-monophosphate kinase